MESSIYCENCPLPQAVETETFSCTMETIKMLRDMAELHHDEGHQIALYSDEVNTLRKMVAQRDDAISVLIEANAGKDQKLRAAMKQIEDMERRPAEILGGDFYDKSIDVIGEQDSDPDDRIAAFDRLWESYAALCQKRHRNGMTVKVEMKEKDLLAAIHGRGVDPELRHGLGRND